ncbi:MAG: FAD-dependent oxidoreductase [Clostridia bacterium]|nr:FAD-dependent oxidoreductase [Clostridia bacterium]
MKYVIIGNGAAAISAAEEIRKNDTEGTIELFSHEKYHTYSRPLISYYLCGETDEKRMLYRSADFYEKMRITPHLGKTVTKIDRERKRIVADKTTYDYDKLLIASGSVPFIPPIAGIEGRKNVYTFLNMEDAKRLKKNISEKDHVVVVGGGLIGFKAAEGLSAVAASVTVVELSERVLTTILDNQAGEIMARRLESHGVRTVLRDSVSSLERDSVTLKSGKTLPCSALVVAVGVRPNAALARECGLDVGRGIICDSSQKTNDSDIYAAGDVCESVDITDGERRVLALLPNAVRQGKVAGSCMSGGKMEFAGGYPMNAIDFFGTYITTAGVINPPAGKGYKVKALSDGDKYRKIVIKDDTLCGFILINDPEQSGVMTSIMADKTKLSSLKKSVKESADMFSFDEKTRFIKLHGRCEI